jgi:hypothetical protein
MKKLLMGAICLSLFAIALSLVQISCSKTEAQNSSTQNNSINKLIYQEEYSNGGSANSYRFSIINLDGTGLQHLNIPFPPGFISPSNHPPVLSPDGTKVYFTGRETANNEIGIYVCDTSGSNLIRLIDRDPNAFDMVIGGAY